MVDSPYEPPKEANREQHDSRVGMACVIFFGVWLIASGFTIVFSAHPQNPFADFTSLLPIKSVPFAIAPYALLLSGVWSLIPRSKQEFVNNFLFTGFIIIGGMFGPHCLTALAATLF